MGRFNLILKRIKAYYHQKKIIKLATRIANLRILIKQLPGPVNRKQRNAAQKRLSKWQDMLDQVKKDSP